MNKKIIALLITGLSLMMTMPIIQPTVRGAGPPYSWAGPTDVDIHLGQDNLPAALQAANGTMWLAWQTFRYTSSRPDIVWKTPTAGDQRLTSSGINTTPTFAQLTNGTIMLFWSQLQTSAFNIYYERFSVNSFTGVGSWSSPVHLVTTTAFNDTAPSATVGADATLWLFWQRSNQSCTGTCTQTKQIYYKTLKNGSWSTPELKITSDNNWNSSPSVVVAKDQIVRLAWSKGGQVVGSTLTSSLIYYKTYNGTTWSSETQIVPTLSGFGDQHPAMIQDRNGTLWVFWGRTSLTTPQFILYNIFSVNSGQSWSPLSLPMITEGSGVDDQQPSAVQGNSNGDKTIHLFYSSDRTNNDYDIWTLTSPSISPVHDLGITSVSSTPNLYAGGMPSVGDVPITTVSVTIANYGDFGENAQATVTVSNSTNISLGSQTQPIGAAQPGALQLWTFAFSWNTSSVKAARYNILASVISTNSTETAGNQGDNSFYTRNSIHLFPWGDIDQDGSVTLQDVSVCFFDFGFTPSTPSRWNPFCDFDYNTDILTGSPTIGIIDAGISVKNFGIYT